MRVSDEASARAWLKHWGDRAFELGIANASIRDLTHSAELCERRQPKRASDFRAAADVIKAAQSEHLDCEQENA